MLCPECHNNVFLRDFKHKEVYCSTCGLIVVAPPSPGFKPAGYLLIIDNKPVDVRKDKQYNRHGRTPQVHKSTKSTKSTNSDHVPTPVARVSAPTPDQNHQTIKK